MKKYFIILFLIINAFAFSQVGISQSNSNNRWTYGGGLGAGFGSGGRFDLQVSPRIGYKLTDNLEAGLMGNVSWQTSDYYKSTMFGIGPFANYYFARNFYLSSSFQQYFINFTNKINDQKYKSDESALYLGGGYMSRIGNNAYFQVGLSYNVLWKENQSIFGSGLIPNIGFVVGL